MKMRAMAVIFALIAATGLSARAAEKRYMIGFRDGTTAAQREAVFESLGVVEVDAIPEIGTWIVEVRGDVEKQRAFSAEANSRPEVLEIQENVRRNWLQGEPSFQNTLLPSLAEARAVLSGKSFSPPRASAEGNADEIPWGVARVNAPAAWSVTRGQGVKVAVIDSGIDCGHPDLKGRCLGGHNILDPSSLPMDENGHGTHVAGTIAGTLDGRGVVGVAPEASLYAVKVLDALGDGDLVSVIKGVVWAGKNRMDVANLSFGAEVGTVFMRAAVKYAQLNGVVLVAAAGNRYAGGPVYCPAAYPEAIAVSALARNGTIWHDSNRGPEIDFIAPGEDVKSSFLEGGTRVLSGTSMAAPHVAGLAALAVARGAHGVDQVREALRRAATPIPGLSSFDQGRGLIDAALLVR